MRSLFCFAILLSIFYFQFSTARQITIAFWNVENLYDTVPSPFYDDREWTPQGANKWNTERYRAKLAALARVLDEMNADLVGLAEVENETVVRDLVQALETDYNYIHLSSGDSRGIDQALLYKGDKFFPASEIPASDPKNHVTRPATPAARLVRSGTGREFLHIEGDLPGLQPSADLPAEPSDRHPAERIHLIVCHMASNLNSTAYRRRNMQTLRTTLENILLDDPCAHIVVMGDMNATPGDELVRTTLGPLETPDDFMYTPHAEHHRAGHGSYNYRGRWYLYDWMMFSPALARTQAEAQAQAVNETHTPTATRTQAQAVNETHTPTATHTQAASATLRAGIYVKEYMTRPASPGPSSPRIPLRTFWGGDYLGGASDHFPVYVVLAK